jgi:Ca2+-binding RTX toxin-like protein
VLCGGWGSDRISGGRGSDRLFGGPGNDTIDARDRASDVVGCGPGRDGVRADRIDLVGVDCEVVGRR